MVRGIAVGGAALGGAGYLLLRLAPAPVELVHQLQAPDDWIARTGTDAAVATVAGALLWLCAAWATIGLAAVWIGQLPGLAGQYGRAVTRYAVPTAIQRLVASATGLSLLLGGAPAGAVGSPVAALDAVGLAAGAPGSAAATATGPGWPLDRPAPTRPVARPAGEPGRLATIRPSPDRPADHPSPMPSGSGGWPLDPSPAADRSPTTPAQAGSTTTAPIRPGQPATPERVAAPRVSVPQPTVTVRPGDSLWTIAGAELGPAATDRQIAIAWPYWYRANRALIGRDPDLLRPGTRLTHPEADPAGDRPDGRPGQPRQPIQEGLRP